MCHSFKVRLTDSGFPKRHIETVEAMTGPGLQKAKELQAKATGGDCLLVLCGDRGPGKTQIATYWASQAKRCQYFRAHDLIEAVRGKFSDDKQQVKESVETLKKARECAFLVLDEFSELSGSEYERKTLTNLLDHRYGDMKATVIITNSKPDQAPTEIGRSAWSRAEETGGIVVCDWPSYRKQ